MVMKQSEGPVTAVNNSASKTHSTERDPPYALSPLEILSPPEHLKLRVKLRKRSAATLFDHKTNVTYLGCAFSPRKSHPRPPWVW